MSMKLVILGILMAGDKHPYDIQQFIKQQDMERYVKFQKGSLYYAVNQLEKSGLIEVVSIVRETNRPDKTIYRITEAGKKECNRLLLKTLSTYEHTYNPLYSALAFVNQVDKKGVLASIRTRIRDTESTLSFLETMYKESDGNIVRYGLHMMAAGIEHLKIDLIMLREMLKDIEQDKFNEIGSIHPYKS